MKKGSIILVLLFIISCSSQNDKVDPQVKEKNDLINKELTEEISKLKTILSEKVNEKDEKQNSLDKLVLEYTKLLDQQTQNKQIFAQQQLGYLKNVEKDRAKIITEMQIIKSNKEEKEKQQQQLQEQLLAISKKLGSADLQQKQILEKNKKELQEIAEKEAEEQALLEQQEKEKEAILKMAEEKIKAEDEVRQKSYQDNLNSIQVEINKIIAQIATEDINYEENLKEYEISKNEEIKTLKKEWSQTLSDLTKNNSEEVKKLHIAYKESQDKLKADIDNLKSSIYYTTKITNQTQKEIDRLEKTINSHKNRISAFLATVKGKTFRFDNSAYRGLYLRLNGSGEYRYFYWQLPGTFSFDAYGRAEFKTKTGETIYLMAIKPDDTYIDTAVRVWASKDKYTRIPKNLKDSDLTSVTYGVDKRKRIYLQFSYDGEIIHASQRFAHSID